MLEARRRLDTIGVVRVLQDIELNRGNKDITLLAKFFEAWQKLVFKSTYADVRNGRFKPHFASTEYR